MNLMDIVGGQRPPLPWVEGDKIPWNDPDFSRRMLREHLSQEHDAASRRFEIIERQVAWIHKRVLKEAPARILDLGCGPGLYTSRLAGLGHSCVGIDFSPASIAYAKAQAAKEGLPCKYVEGDLRAADYGSGFDLVMSIYGEFNVFRPEEAKRILRKAYQALVPGGILLLEPHTFEAVLGIGEQESSWYAAEQGLFSDRPHLCLGESVWDAAQKAAVQRFYIIDAASGQVARHGATTQAYTDEEYRALLAEGGFSEVVSFPTLGERGEKGDTFVCFLAQKSRA